MGLDWKEMWRDAGKRAAELTRAGPKLVAGYKAVAFTETTTGALDLKTRELIAVAVAVTTRCDACIASHVRAARLAGATEPELTDALATTIALNAGAAYAYSGRALEAFDQLEP